MYNKTVPRLVLIVVLVASFLFVPVTSVEALQSPTYSDNTYWRWWYVEQSTGVSVENAENTDYGIGTGEYISNNGGGSRADAYTWVKDKYDNAVNATANSIDYYYNVVDDIYNKSVDYAEKGYYTAENALRKTVDTAGKTVYNVSSSDFWNGFYNSMFNGGGYKDKYSQGNNNSYNTEVNGGNVNISYVGIYILKPNQIPLNGIFQNAYELNAYEQIYYSSNNTYEGNILINAGGEYIILSPGYNYGNVYYGEIEVINYDSSARKYNIKCTLYRTADRVETFNTAIYLKNGYTGSEVTNGSTPVLQPSQMGFIINPQTGARIPVYTDTTQNPFTINPDGTVTMPDGTTVPIYIDPEDISNDGWLWLLKYIDDRDKTEPTQNPYGQPWNTQNDGTALGGFFSGLLSDISSLFSGLIDSIKKIFEGLAKIIADAIKNLIDSLLDFNMNDIQFSTPIEFNLIDAVVEKFFNMFGIEV